MKIQRSSQVELQNVTMEGAAGCQVRWLVDEAGGAPNFAMRMFEVAPGGHTPRHSHPYEHEVFILEGRGVAVQDDKEHPLQAGDVVFVVPGDVHQFRNTGDAPLKFLCLVPNSASSLPVTVAAECSVVAKER